MARRHCSVVDYTQRDCSVVDYTLLFKECLDWLIIKLLIMLLDSNKGSLTDGD